MAAAPPPSPAELFFPPFSRIHAQLERLRLEPEAASQAELQAALQEYEPWLAQGLRGFRPPSAASRRALEGDAPLAVAGGKKLPVEAALRQPAFELSAALRLDEVQAYLLLRRWLAAQAPATGAPAGASALAALRAGGGLRPEHRAAVAALFWQERLSLLQAVEGLLWLGEGERGGVATTALALRGCSESTTVCTNPRGLLCC